MTIQQAIEKAIEGGYRPTGDKNDYRTELVIRAMRKEAILLDPLFWQALGKAMGWLKYTRDDECSADNLDIKEISNQKWNETWLYHWHRLIDHLAEGKDIESFFEKLNL